MITVITPTTGKDSLFHAIKSLQNQTSTGPIKHIILWDHKREGRFLYPNGVDPAIPMAKDPMDLEVHGDTYSSSCIVINDDMVQGTAAGSALRAVGLMAANTEFVTFMDDDVMWDTNHLESIAKTMADDSNGGSNWGFCKRRIWTPNDENFECLGIDEFESVGEDSKTPYKMVDNNCMFFKAKFGFSAATLYRNTKEYNDDRLMYSFLMRYAGDPAKTNKTTINQVCPERLISHFRDNCTKE